MTDRRPPFKYSAFTRVGFSDTDAQGIVYYGRYLPYFDLARVEYHRHLGLLGLDTGGELVMRVQHRVPRPCPLRRAPRSVHSRLAHRPDERNVRDVGLPGGGRPVDGDGDPGARARRPRRAQGAIPDVVRERIRAFEGDDVEL